MPLPGAGKRLKPPKGKGIKFRDKAAQVAKVTSQLAMNNPGDPAGIGLVVDTTHYAAMGATFAGPVGGIIGAGIGFFKGIFSWAARAKAKRIAKQNRIRQAKEAKQLLDTKAIEGRVAQLETAGRSLESSQHEWETYLHQSLAQELARSKAPPRHLSFSQTGRTSKIQSAQYEKILLAQSTIIADKASERVLNQEKALEEINKYKEEIEGASRDVEANPNLAFNDIDSSNIDQVWGHSSAYRIAQDKSRVKKIEKRLDTL